MQKNVLKGFETFSEFPDKYLCINNKSNYYYIKKDDKSFVAIRSIELISTDGKDTNVILAYYNVLDESLVLKTKITESQDKITKEMNGAKVVPLNELFDIKNNNSCYLNLEDVNALTGFREENTKTYGITPKKD